MDKEESITNNDRESDVFKKCLWVAFWGTFILYTGIGIGQSLHTWPIYWGDYQQFYKAISSLIGLGTAWLILLLVNKVFNYLGLTQVKLDNSRSLDHSSFASFWGIFLGAISGFGLAILISINVPTIINF